MNRKTYPRGLAVLCSAFALAALAACGGGASTGSGSVSGPSPTPTQAPPPPVAAVSSTTVATLEQPWSMLFLPDGRILVTSRPPVTAEVPNPVKPGTLRVVTQAGLVSEPIPGMVANVGLLDVVLDPSYSSNRRIYISFMERDPAALRVGRAAGESAIDPAGLAVMRGTLTLNADGTGRIDDPTVIWRQTPKIVTYPGSGEPGGRMVFSRDGTYLFVTSGVRQEQDSAFPQSLNNTLGKIIRIFPDGTIPPDNPFVGRSDAMPEIWSLGHRNPYGLAYSLSGDLWSHEMGPAGGDEFNLIAAAGNYGWADVSYGTQYGGAAIPNPKPGDGFVAPALWWTPVIAPSGIIFYSGTTFGDWRGDAIISGLQSKGLVRVRVEGTTAREMQRIDLGNRIRAVAQGPDGAIWVLEDQPSGRLRKLAPVL